MRLEIDEQILCEKEQARRMAPGEKRTGIEDWTKNTENKLRLFGEHYEKDPVRFLAAKAFAQPRMSKAEAETAKQYEHKIMATKAFGCRALRNDSVWTKAQVRLSLLSWYLCGR